MSEPTNLPAKLLSLKDCGVHVSEHDAYPEEGQASVNVVFSNGARLRAGYWRLSKDGRAVVSSFDHKQQYGLPAPIDAVGWLKGELQAAKVSDARHDLETGDLLFSFSNNVKLQVLNVTAYEIWAIFFADGTGAYSNYKK